MRRFTERLGEIHIDPYSPCIKKTKGATTRRTRPTTQASPRRQPAGKNTEESEINNIGCLLASVCVCVFACVSRGNNSYASHTLLCQIDGSIGMPPVSLKTSKRQRLEKKSEREEEQRECNCRCRVCSWKTIVLSLQMYKSPPPLYTADVIFHNG